MRFYIYASIRIRTKSRTCRKYHIALEPADRMVVDALVRIKTVDDSLSLRRSCREGVCGSDGMNINGRNGLACITPVAGLKEPVELRPLPGLPVIRDLIVDMTQFFQQYHSIKPYLINNDPPPETERLQSPKERAELDGLYECILCAAVPRRALILVESRQICGTPACGGVPLSRRRRDQATRSDWITGRPLSPFRCHSIMNCVDVCPRFDQQAHGRIRT